MNRVGRAACGAILVLAAMGPLAAAGADEADSTRTPGAADAPAPPAAFAGARQSGGLEALVPEIASQPYHLEPGLRPFRNRLSFSPGFGSLGAERLYTIRVAYNPNAWLGYEAALGHNPGQSVHAVIHTLSALLRRPLTGRVQPYATCGYGMMMVLPGRTLNADPVTRNTLTVGGGLELYIRSDLAIRAEIRDATAFGSRNDRAGAVEYNYAQETIGLAFYRSITP